MNGVKVVDSSTPDFSQEQETKSESTSLEDLGVPVDTENLSDDQVERAKNLLGSWSSIFSKGPTDFGKADIVKHELNLTNNKPFKEPYRKIQPGLYDEVRLHRKELLEAVAIRESQVRFRLMSCW